MKTKVRMTGNGNQDFAWSEGEEGYIDGHIAGERIYVVVVLGNRLVYCHFHDFEVLPA